MARYVQVMSSHQVDTLIKSLLLRLIVHSYSYLTCNYYCPVRITREVKGAILCIKMSLGRVTNFDVAGFYVMEMRQYFSKYELCVTNLKFRPKSELLEAKKT